MSNRPWHQFTIRRLLVLTTAVAAVIGGVWATPLPEFARMLLGAYFLVIVGYEIVRGPSRNAGFEELRNRREQLATRRRELMRETEELRNRGPARSAPEPDANDGPSD
jgi:hypothetical protein